MGTATWGLRFMLPRTTRHRLMLSHNPEGLVDPSECLTKPFRLLHHILL